MIILKFDGFQHSLDRILSVSLSFFPHFSIAWHLSTCLRYPFFVFGSTGFSFSWSANSDHFQFLLSRKIPAMDGRLGASYFPPAKIQPLASTFAQTRRYIHGLTSTSFKTCIIINIFASTQPGAVSTCTSYDFTHKLFLLVPSRLCSTELRQYLFLRSLIRLGIFSLFHLFVINFPKNLFRISWVENGALGGGFIFILYQNQCVRNYIGSMLSMECRKSEDYL